MIRYTATIFISAFLLFLVQPMIARFILPWFGGTSAVWTTCMMFFQTVLLIGYLYAHLVRRWFAPRTAFLIHAGLLLIAAVSLKVAPPESFKPEGGENLTWSIVWLLFVTVGLPFLALSATGPLVQAWHSLSHGGRTYRLYAVSNLGSILALVSYPFLFERYFKLREQSFGWAIAFVVFAVLCVASAFQTFGRNSWARSAETVSGKSPRLAVIALWIGLAMAPSIVLLATTNLMCSEVASIPFLWILPLSLYLLSLIICFDRPGLYRRWFFFPLAIVSAVAATIVMLLGAQLTLLPQIVAFATTCFACGMICHGELERIKPDTQHLTLFYLMVSVGGALGGIFVAVIAPMIFSDYFEFHIGLAASIVLPVTLMIYQEYKRDKPRTLSAWATVFGALIAITCVGCSVFHILFTGIRDDVLVRVRNEYGLVLIVEDAERAGGPYRKMVNGRTEHGGQFLDEPKQMEPSGYYLDGCGPSLAIKAMRDSRAGRPLKVGVIGLGTGSLVTWARPGDEFCFYEINPVVESLAREYFTYLNGEDPKTKVITGDGRVQLERQYVATGSEKFDVICMDAFTSDSIPAHLLTEECFELYLNHLRNDGVIVVHITNTFVDLRPVLYEQARNYGLVPYLIDHNPDPEHETRWVLLTPDLNSQLHDVVSDIQSPWPDDMPRIEWTDDFSSLANLVDWSVGLELDYKREAENRNEEESNEPR
ncbi:MAG: fused MFS/spermidine synthase [Planctomycetota bacterium]